MPFAADIERDMIEPELLLADILEVGRDRSMPAGGCIEIALQVDLHVFHISRQLAGGCPRYWASWPNEMSLACSCVFVS